MRRTDIATPSGAKDLKDVKVIRPSAQDTISGMKNAVEQWRDTFGG